MSTEPTIHHGDALDVLRALPDNSVDSVVTDPPYGLEFMGKEWDAFRPERDERMAGRYGAGAVTGAAGLPTTNRAPRFGGQRRMTWRCDTCQVRSPIDRRHATPDCPGAWAREVVDPAAPSPLLPFQQWCEMWAVECLRVLKPGGHLLAFGGTRTWHRLTVAVEDAGFEIRDSIAWLYGSGFPKSLDVSKAIDKAAGAEREAIGRTSRATGPSQASGYNGSSTFREPNWQDSNVLTAPATPAAQQWQGWGTALKPAFEPIVVARKPLAGTVAANVQAWGTGALNIDSCRVATDEDRSRPPRTPNAIFGGGKGTNLTASESNPAGRWPANVVLDGSQADALDQQSGVMRDGVAVKRNRDGKPQGTSSWSLPGAAREDAGYGGEGGASRFFPTFRYQAKAPTRERVTYAREGEGADFLGDRDKRCTKCGKQRVNVPGAFCVCAEPDFQPDPKRAGKVAHPTVKPLDLMRWLVRLVTPPGGTVLEPFAGSGTTVEAAMLEGFGCVAIEREADYLPLIDQRIARAREALAVAAAEAAAPAQDALDLDSLTG